MDLDVLSDKLEENIIKREKEVLDIVKDCFLSNDDAKINLAIVRHAAIYSFYSTHYALAKIRNVESENAMNDYVIERSGAIKAAYDVKGKKYTETTIKQLAQDNEFKRLREVYLKANKCELILQSAVRSLEQKKDMLFSLASNMRADLKSGIKIASDEISKLYKKGE